MAKPRGEIVDPQTTCYYHVTSRCVRRAFLLQDGDDQRRNLLLKQLQLLDQVFAVDVCGFGILENHIHIVLRLHPDEAEVWSDRQVVLRWAKIHPPRNGAWQVVDVTEQWINERLQDGQWVVDTRRKLTDLSQFMKDLKQPIAQIANRSDGVTGHYDIKNDVLTDLGPGHGLDGNDNGLVVSAWNACCGSHGNGRPRGHTSRGASFEDMQDGLNGLYEGDVDSL